MTSSPDTSASDPAAASTSGLQRYADIAFSPTVLDHQVAKGSRSMYAEAAQTWPVPTELGEDERSFLRETDSFYMASTSETGWPYVQHRGGPTGFVKVLGPTTIGWVERNGNRQYVSAGNTTTNGRVALIVVDYPNRRRIKLYGHATHHRSPSEELVASLDAADIRNDGAFTIEVASFEWNCPKYITPKYTAEDINAVTASLQAKIVDLEKQLESQ